MPRPELTPDEILGILGTTMPDLRQIANSMTNAQLDRVARPDDWSIRYIIGHLHASEDVLGTQMMRIVAEDRPRWRRLSPREHHLKTDYGTWPVDKELDAMDEHRRQLLSALEPLPADGWTRIAVVTDAPGRIVEHTVRFYGNWLADHERGHIEQIRELVTR